MKEKKMTFDEFKEQVRIELARRLHVDANSDKVSERIEEEDSKDIIMGMWDGYNNRVDSGIPPFKAQRQEFAVAANCIAML